MTNDVIVRSIEVHMEDLFLATNMRPDKPLDVTQFVVDVSTDAAWAAEAGADFAAE